MFQSPEPTRTRWRLLVPAPEAAQSLSVCEKTLWSITEPRGDLPCVRIGRRVLASYRRRFAMLPLLCFQLQYRKLIRRRERIRKEDSPSPPLELQETPAC